MKNKTSKILLIVSGAMTAAICLIMNFVLIPKIEATTNGIRCFDMNFAYSYETARKFLSLLSEEGRNVYLNIQLPLDFIYPIAYCIFFVLLILKLTEKKWLCALPIVLGILDYTENICTVIMLKKGTPEKALVQFASFTTSAKTIMLYLIILIIIVMIIVNIIRKKKN